MNRDFIYRVREIKGMNEFLKYNSFLYKDIIRGNISVKKINEMMNQGLKMTLGDRLSNINDKMELVNAFLQFLK